MNEEMSPEVQIGTPNPINSESMETERLSPAERGKAILERIKDEIRYAPGEAAAAVGSLAFTGFLAYESAQGFLGNVVAVSHLAGSEGIYTNTGTGLGLAAFALAWATITGAAAISANDKYNWSSNKYDRERRKREAGDEQ